jgi:predicted enzyme related to lactoylglutathione lyase
MTGSPADALVHLELQTNDLLRARTFLEQLFGWRAETVRVGGHPYVTLDLGGEIGGGIVERGTGRSEWIPYVEVFDVEEAAERGSWSHGGARAARGTGGMAKCARRARGRRDRPVAAEAMSREVDAGGGGEP